MHLRPPSSLRKAHVFGAVLLTLAVFVAGASAGSGQYPTPLYLTGIASSTLSTSYTLVASTGAGATSRPTPTAAICGGCGAGNLGASSSTYSYRYTLVDAGGETAPSAPVSVSSVHLQQVTVGGLPTGVTVRLYRTTALTTNLLYLVAQLTNNSSSTYTDNVADGSLGVLLPQAQNRYTTLGTGWTEYQPGGAINNNSTSGACILVVGSCTVASPAFDGHGWLVDGAGSVYFPAGSWSSTVKITSAGTGGTGRLAMGMWKVNSSGTVDGSALIDPTCSTAPCGSGGQPGLNVVANISTAVGTASAITTTFASMPAFSLTAGEHLYVQFYRDEAPTGASGNTVSTLSTYDGVAQITHPAADSLPTYPTLVTPADTTSTNSAALTATFNDPDAGDTGTVEFRVCTAQATAGTQCTPTAVADSTSVSTANGANASWSPAIADGTYYWQAQATDAAGGQSGWSATHTFTLDTTPPDTTIGSGPASLTNSASASFGFTATEGSSTFQCQLDGGGYTSCTSPKNYAGLASGSHTFQVKATDPAGNIASPASESWTVDTAAPVTTIGAGPAGLTNVTNASFSFSASKAGSTLQCQLDSGASTACTSPQSYTGLADGSHTFQVVATDPAGNTSSAATATWTVDTVAPVATIATNPASVTTSANASFTFSASKDGSSFECQLDGGAYTACTSPQGFTGLGDGSHTLQVEATDPAGNTSSPAAWSWTIDTTPPGLPDIVGPQDGDHTSSHQLEATFRDTSAGGTGTITYRVCSDASCASPVATGTSTVLGSGQDVTWTIPGLVGGKTYFWQAMAQDALGNQSAWTAAAAFTLGPATPGQPIQFGGDIGPDGLTLHWAPPAGGPPVAGYVLYVNGRRSLAIDSGSRKMTVGAFGADDPRTFALAAVGAAGNVGPRTDTLAGVPNLVGLRLSEAIAALDARGLVLGGKQTLSTGADAALVVSQRPAAGASLALADTPVFVVLSSPSGAVGAGPAASSGTPLAIHVGGAQTISCAGSGQLTFHTRLSRAAKVDVRFLSVAGVPLASKSFPRVPAGSGEIHVALPSGSSVGQRYRMIVTASTSGQIVRAEFALTITAPALRATADSTSCSA